MFSPQEDSCRGTALEKVGEGGRSQTLEEASEEVHCPIGQWGATEGFEYGCDMSRSSISHCANSCGGDRPAGDRLRGRKTGQKVGTSQER